MFLSLKVYIVCNGYFILFILLSLTALIITLIIELGIEFMVFLILPLIRILFNYS